MEFVNGKFIKHRLGDTALIYSTKGDITSFTCVPYDLVDKVNDQKLFKEIVDKRFTHLRLEPMVQIAFLGDMYKRDFSAGVTMHDAYTSLALRAFDQEVINLLGEQKIITHLRNERGINVKHIISHRDNYNVLQSEVEITNNSSKEMMLEMASSFVLSNLSPFMGENHIDKLILHRFQNYWSAECRKESVPISHYNMEDSWSSFGVKVQRIGQVGSMPARCYLPFVALEDTQNNVTWAVQLYAPDSWQIEVIQKDSAVSLTGGHADYLYGHWRKKLAPGKSFRTQPAYFTVVNGNLEEACANLTAFHDTMLTFPASEENLPVLYNEYLYTWGHPTMEKLIPQMDCAKKLGVDYFVVDAGWFESFDDLMGDWEVDNKKFPKGLKELKQELDKRGLLGGVWYEFESATSNSKVAKLHPEWLLTRDGVLINHYNRMFLDFRKPEVIDYLTDKVINVLKENGLKYIKIDYNENIGIGADGAESLGEGLRQHIQNVVAFYKKIRKEIPDLVMEVCSSGGMRHEPCFMTLGSMVSFSDAHEGPEGAVIALDLHRYMQPRIMQIWACLKPEYSKNDICFTLVKAMLGRICLSGDLTALSEEYKEITKEAIKFYNVIKPIIKKGKTVLVDSDQITSLRNLNGVARLARVSKDGKHMLCYAFAFSQPSQLVEFDTKGYKVVSSFGDGQVSDQGIITSGSRWSGTVMLLEKV